MPTEKEVYESHADLYELLILREDYLGNIPNEIGKIRDITGKNIIEFGAGTGRLTRDIVRKARSVNACDASHHMLTKAKYILGETGCINYSLIVADMRYSPFQNRSADIVISGWSFCYLAVWGGEHWEKELLNGLDEAKRLLKPGGAVILLENFGTGFDRPHPPEHLNEYFKFLQKYGFQSRWFRTDYEFKSLEEAVDLSGFFFGEEMTEKVRRNSWRILPECTGLLWMEV